MLGACRNGNLDQIKALIQADRRRAVNVDEAGATPLHRVCSYNHVECGQYLIDNNADVNGLDKYHEAPMKRAAYNGHVDSLVMLLKAGANANYADPTGKMALHHAAEQGRLQCVEALLDNGALVDAEDQHYTTPLLLAAGNGHTTVCRVLLENGAHVNGRGGTFFSSALHMAAQGGHTHTVALLLKEGADQSLADSQGRTPALMCMDRKTRDVFDSHLLRSKVHPQSSIVSGPGLQAEVVASDACAVEIQPCDRFGRRLQDLGGHVRYTAEVVDLHSGESTSAKVTPSLAQANSIFFYDGSRAGDFLIHVHQRDVLEEGATEPASVPVGGSPFSVSVVAAMPDPYATRATGHGVTRAPSAQPTSFTVFCRDRFSNPRPGTAIKVLSSPDQRVPADLRIEHQGNGEYLVSYTAPAESGLMHLTVAIDGGKHIYNSPFPVFVAPGEAVASQCEAAGRGLARGGTLQPTRFRIHARDAAGNHLREGGLAFTVKITPVNAISARAAKVETEVVDLHNGVYEVSFVPKLVGCHKTSVALDGAPIRGSPFDTLIFELPDWESEEVAQWVEGIGLPMHADAFVSRDIKGFMLPGLTVDTLDHDLGVRNKNIQSKIQQHVRDETANDSVDFKGAETLDEHSLVLLGAAQGQTRARLLEAVRAEEKTNEAMVDVDNPAHAALYEPRLQASLWSTGEELHSLLEEKVETCVSTTTQALLTALYSDKAVDQFALTRIFIQFESNLKQNVDAQIRATCIKEDEGAEDSESESFAFSQGSSSSEEEDAVFELERHKMMEAAAAESGASSSDEGPDGEDGAHGARGGAAGEAGGEDAGEDADASLDEA